MDGDAGDNNTAYITLIELPEGIFERFYQHTIEAPQKSLGPVGKCRVRIQYNGWPFLFALCNVVLINGKKEIGRSKWTKATENAKSAPHTEIRSELFVKSGDLDPRRMLLPAFMDALH